MGLFSKRQSSSDDDSGPRNGTGSNAVGIASVDPRIENAGRWPVRVTDFYLAEPYEQPPVDYLEIFFVRSGSFLHESDAGRQTHRDGAVIISHPQNRHVLKHVEHCHLTRLRFLPEWLTPDFVHLLRARFAISAIFGRSWFDLPERDSIHVFDTRLERREHLISSLNLLKSLLVEQAQAADEKFSGDSQLLIRATLVSFLLQIGAEFGTFLRQKGGVSLPAECQHFMTQAELKLNSTKPLNPEEFEDAEPGGSEEESFADRFRKATGLVPSDYLLRRRLDHAAYCLLSSERRTGKIATSLGFADSGALAKPFEARFRVTPAVYRQKFSPPPR